MSQPCFRRAWPHFSSFILHITIPRQGGRSHDQLTLFPLESHGWKFKTHRVLDLVGNAAVTVHMNPCTKKKKDRVGLGLITTIVLALAVSLTFSRHWPNPFEGSSLLKWDHSSGKCVTIMASIMRMEEQRRKGLGI